MRQALRLDNEADTHRLLNHALKTVGPGVLAREDRSNFLEEGFLKVDAIPIFCYFFTVPLFATKKHGIVQ